MNLQTEEYVQNALKTESNNFAEISERLTCQLINELYIQSNHSEELGDSEDKYKKHLFYGKSYKEPHVVDEWSVLDDEQITAIKERFTSQNIRLLHAAMGMITEAVEFKNAVVAHIFEGKDLDVINLGEELSDSFWYSAIAADALGYSSFNEIMETNIAKLKARYGDKFTSEAAVNRNLDKEVEVLKAGL